MKKKSASTSTTGKTLKVFGTVRDQHKQPVPELTVHVSSKSTRSKTLLGEATTNDSGFYEISITPKKLTPAVVLVCIYDDKTLLKEIEYHNHNGSLNADIDLNGQEFKGFPEYEQLMDAVEPLIDGVSLSALTETDKERDISFITEKTGFTTEQVEKLAMAARFETFSSIAAHVWYAILQQNLPRIPKSVNGPSLADFEARLDKTFDALMHTSVEAMVKAVQKSIDENIIAASVKSELEDIRKQLSEQLLAYAKKHPVTGEPSRLHKTLEIAGLKGKALHSFIESRVNHVGTEQDFWNSLEKDVKDRETVDQLKAVFHLSGLTGHHHELVEKLVKSHKIKSLADLKKLAALDKHEWAELVNEQQVQPHAASFGKNKTEKTQSFATQLEAAFTHTFPSVAFGSRLQKDTSNKLPHKKAISKILLEHDDFDLLHSRVGEFVKEKHSNLPEEESKEITEHLRKVQRVFKLSPKYETASALLNEDIHSAHQVVKMGEDNFVRTFSDKIGEAEATEIFQRASSVHAQTVALVGNLKSLSDASTMNAFTSLAPSIATTLATEIPNVDTLFGHSSACDCSECRSVYGAPAYLTDILHFLDKRLSTLAASGGRTPTVKDLLLRRRPDIAELDLECNNSNTEVPYIDIACELMEDFISAPLSAMFANSTLLSKLVKGPIDATLLSSIKSAFSSSGHSNFGNLLTSAAIVSDKYTTTRLQTDNTFLTQDNWVIRDSQLVIKVTNLGTNLQCRVLHQTLLPAEAVSAGSEFINVKAYDSLKTAKRPFTLPFDLFNTEGELYLEKLGTKKQDLINIFSRVGPPVLNSTVDINMGYASLGINQAEQGLIFTADVANQALYWGADASSTAIQVNIFEKLSGLNYTQIVNLLQLTFINPTKNSVIEHDEVTSGITAQRITNITTTKLDAMHRFLRFWRKTTLTMDELDAFIVNMSVQNGFGSPTLNSLLADEMRHFILLQQSLQLTPFELLAFYGNLDTTHGLPNCQYNLVYQNSALTNPVYPAFSLAAIQASTVTLLDPDKLVICSILQISLAELNATLSQTGTAVVITVQTLSVLYRHAKLAQALGITLTDLLTLLRLINTNPFANPATTSQFVNRYKQLQAFGFSIDELNYILRHQNNVAKTIVPPTDQRQAALDQLQSDLMAIKTAIAAPVDANGVLLTKWLSDAVLKWDTSLVNRLMDILTTIDTDAYRQKITDNTNFLLNLRAGYSDAVLRVDLAALPVVGGNPITIPASLSAQLSFDTDKKQLVLRGVMSTADRDALLALSTDTVYQAAVNALFNKITTSSSTSNSFFTSATDVGNRLNNLLFANIVDRFAFFINKLAPVYKGLLQKDALTNNISTWFSIDKKLVTTVLINVPEVTTDFTADNFINKVIDTTVVGNPYPTQANRYQFLAKFFFVFRKLNISPLAQEHAVKLFFTSGPTRMGCLDFKALPLAAVSGSVSTYPGFEALLNLRRFDQLYPVRVIPFTTGGAGVYDVYGQLTALGQLLPTGAVTEIPAALTQFASNLAFPYGWNTTDLQTVLTANFTVIADFTAVSFIMLRLHEIFTTLQQLGVSLADAQSWCAASLTITDSTKIKNTLKAKSSSSDWLQITKPLQDKLRERKRDALIAYLLTNPGTQTWKDADDLFGYFLLDVQMCSCQPTSRIVEATNAVQLFVQRCFLRLEDNVVVKTKADTNTSVAPDSNWLQWKWMKNFRVWQSNVKVFLYPENWVEPELLPDDIKSPFLKELEDELLQNEVTPTSAEDAFRGYLEKLDSVARLEVKGMWYDHPTRTLHVLARSFGGNPRVYYHRKLIADKRWTPWKKVDLDITGDHVVLAMYNNRLYIFWAVISEKFDKTATSNNNVNIPAPVGGVYNIPVVDAKKKWQIQIAFSEYKNGKWQPKKISESDAFGSIEVSQTTFPNKENFFFPALDVPNFEYNKIFNNGAPIDSLEVFNLKAAAAVTQTGKLVISCYYSNIKQDNTTEIKYVGSFRLDPVKGYPIQFSANYIIMLNQAPSHQERSSRKSIMNNMLDTESFTVAGAPTPPTTGIPGGPGAILVAEQAGGGFSNAIPMQMDVDGRYNYLFNIYSSGLSGSFQVQAQIGLHLPYFYQDQKRSYYVVDEWTNNGAVEYLYSDNYDLTLKYLKEGLAAYQSALNAIDASLGLAAGTVPSFIGRYFNFHHPLVDYFMQQLFSGGIDGLMSRTTQLKGDFGYDPDPAKFDFEKYFQPVISGFSTIYSGANLPPVTRNGVTDSKPGYPKDDVDFNLQSGYGLYNWELFFHAPLMIAERLSQNQQFEEAARWYQFIFNPMDTSSFDNPNKYWNTKPFFLTTSADYANQSIEGILKDVNNNVPTVIKTDVDKNVTDWRNNPFQPHFIAQSRTVAYQKSVVMKYVGHLIRHGDFLFRQHTMESVNEATQLYILAQEILGPKPEVIPSPVTTGVDNYYQLESKLDALSDALVNVENLMPFHTIKNYNGIVPTGTLPTLKTMYFCIPMNENLTGPTGHWDVVADRLFKIRHCMNIDGTFAPLSLFAPAIDPGLLVRASAAGLDIGSVLNDANTPLPVYRFNVMVQKATELCNDVKTLGASLLSTLEKKDAEGLALLRSGHEQKLLGSVLEIKQKQIEDAQSVLDNLDKQKELITVRKKYYEGLLRAGLNHQEKAALGLNGISRFAENAIALGYLAASSVSLIPQVVMGVSGLGSAVATASAGSQQLGNAAERAVRTLQAIATASDKSASILNTTSGYLRRAQDWQYQLDLANKELEQIEKQILGAQIRLSIAQKDVANQQLQIEQSKESDDFMRNKFTNQELFSWMVTQISSTYFKSYQLAYDVAKQTERCFRHELGLADSGYINFGYWDNLKKGLLAGEMLFYDIKKMEMAYMDQNKRELELTKPISLSQLDPAALLKLKTNGDCWINLPEELFDMDYPGHYMRRIKSVSVTIPCITGPYTTVSAKLTMTKNSVRVSGVAASDATQYPRKLSGGFPADDLRFRDGSGSLQSIATSNAQNDSGLFELNFRDERYLPFEGAGAISQWHLELPAAVRQFDYNSISDVIITVKYTARDAGDVLKAQATTSLNTRINQMLVSLSDRGLMRIFSAKNDLATEWYKFLHPANPADGQVLILNLDRSRFPLFAQGKTIKIASIEIVADSTIPFTGIPLQVFPAPSGTNAFTPTATGAYGSLLNVTVDYGTAKPDPGTWQIKNPVANHQFTDAELNNMTIIVHYEVS
jgi:hypothetical protein